MRILIDLHHLGGQQTGNETWGRGISSALAARRPDDIDYDLALTRGAPTESLELSCFREVVPVSGSSIRRLAVDLPRLVRSLRSDALLVQYTMPVTTVPCVVAIHDLSFEQPRAGEWLPLATRMRYRATIRASARRAAHVLALSDHTRADLITHFGLAPERVTAVYAGVDPDLAARVAAVREGVAADHRTVLAVGTVLPRKNLVVVAKAVAAVRAAGDDVRLHVLGPVPADGRAVADEIRALLPAAGVTFTGYATVDELAHAYVHADVLAYPSLYEGFGLPVVEAMAAGLPVIVSDASCLPEISAGGALVLPADDVAAWHDGIAAVLRDSDLRLRLTDAGTRRAAHFTWDRAAQQVETILRAAVS